MQGFILIHTYTLFVLFVYVNTCSKAWGKGNSGIAVAATRSRFATVGCQLGKPVSELLHLESYQLY